MTTKPGDYLGGIRTVEDLRQRCWVDEQTGCWHWRLFAHRGRPQVCYMLPDGTPRRSAGRRAALELARGARLPRSVDVFAARSKCSGASDCCNPAHARTGSRSELLRARSLSAASRNAMCLSATRLQRSKSSITMEIARRIRASADTTAVEAARWGISKSTVGAIRRGDIWRENPLAAPPRRKARRARPCHAKGTP